MARAGVDLDAAASDVRRARQAHLDALGAVRVEHFTWQGQVSGSVEHIDHGTRQRAADALIDLHGVKPSKTAQLQSGVVEAPVINILIASGDSHVISGDSRADVVEVPRHAEVEPPAQVPRVSA